MNLVLVELLSLLCEERAWVRARPGMESYIPGEGIRTSMGAGGGLVAPTGLSVKEKKSRITSRLGDGGCVAANLEQEARFWWRLVNETYPSYKWKVCRPQICETLKTNVRSFPLPTD